MKCFASPAHLSSWSRLCPPNNHSGGKRRRGKWSGQNRSLRTALIQAANAAAHTNNCALAALYHRIRAPSGHQHAVFVVARYILELAWLGLAGAPLTTKSVHVTFSAAALNKASAVASANSSASVTRLPLLRFPPLHMYHVIHCSRPGIDAWPGASTPKPPSPKYAFS